MTRLSLTPLFILLATQASAHAAPAAHAHTSDTLSLATVLTISLGLMGLSLGAAALLRARSK
ncbi:MAG: hypothetical protein ACI8R4_001627 [Paracoccaceae bacterium]|jgi:hypothetical protein